jgi:hypothetical protein
MDCPFPQGAQHGCPPRQRQRPRPFARADRGALISPRGSVTMPAVREDPMRPETPPELIALNATLFLLGYFIPTFIALTRQRDQRLRLFLTNLLTGWTLIGWMVAFIWAVTLPWDLGRRRDPSR